LHRELSALIETHRPHVLAVENVFFAKNAVSALKLGQARGVVVLTAALFGLELHEYSATQVKRSVAGHGGADKEQVSKMLQLQLGAQGFDTPDASDGLALAVHHAFSIALNSVSNRAGSKDLKDALSPKRRSKSLAHALKHRIKPISR
jgi:crossover junction endodeoxyribonuclease RuvC